MKRTLKRAGVLAAFLLALSQGSAWAQEPEQEEALIDVPRYTLEKPTQGFQLSLTPTAFDSKKSLIPASQPLVLRSISLQWEYQPRFIQKYGVLGIGPLLSWYLPSSPGSVTIEKEATGGTFFGLWSAGAQIRYQAHFFRQQFLVPHLGLRFESLSYRWDDGTQGRLSFFGPYFGLMLLLNALEPSAAAENYVAWGITRVYLNAEYQSRSASNGGTHLEGQSFSFALRFEY